jgi:hypothetical protein
VYGYATPLGGTGVYSASSMCVRPVTIGQNGSVVDLGIIAPTAGVGVVMGLYTDSAGVPGTLVVETAEATLTGATLTIATPPTPVAAGNYWVAVLFNGTTTVDEDPSVTVVAYCAGTSFGPTLPASFPTSPSYTGRLADFYVLVR